MRLRIPRQNSMAYQSRRRWHTRRLQNVCAAVLAISGAAGTARAAPENVSAVTTATGSKATATATATATANGCGSAQNRPPIWPENIEYNSKVSSIPNGHKVTIRTGRTLDADFVASDPEGDTVTYEVRRAPDGASFDPVRGSLSWRPSSRDLGSHQLVLAASDGCRSSTLSIGITVVPNRPPYDEDNLQDKQVAFIGNRLRGTIARDPDEDPLTLSVTTLPLGAKLNTNAQDISIDWTPTEANLGDNWFDFAVSDGEFTTQVRKQVTVLPAEARGDQSIYMAPAAGYSFMATDGGGHGYHGANVSLMLFAHAPRGDDGYRCAQGIDKGCAASHIGFYLTSELLFPTHDEDARVFTYAFGVTRSLEFGPTRKWLIPNASAEIGGWVDSKVGHVAQVSPMLGVHLWADRHVWLDLNCGYRMVPAELRSLSGPRATLSLMVNAW
jgi:hypothetical protein